MEEDSPRRSEDAPAGQISIEETLREEVDPMTLPPHGSEVFVGGLDRSATEEQIREFASEAGEVFGVKMMMDTANPTQNRGYSFVTFVDKESALKAMDTLSNKEMKDFPRHRIRVQPSQAKNKVWIGGLLHTLDEAALREALEAFDLKGLTKIDLAKSRDSPGTNRGFAFLEFYNSSAASQAKSKLSAPDVRISDRTVNVELAEPTGRDQASVGGSKTIFVGNLPIGVTEDSLKNAFSTFGEIENVNIPKPKENEDHSKFAFVHFTERLAASHAVEAEQKPEIDGVQLVVKYGRTDAHGSQGYGGRGGGYGNYQQQQQYSQQYGGMGMPRGGMMMGGMGGMMPMVPVQLPNGQMGYMLQPGSMMGGDGGIGYGMGGGPMRTRGGYRGGRRGGYGGGGRGAGYGGRGGGGGGPRYQPY